MPNKKSEMNVNPVGNELQQINWVWPDGTRAERKRLYETYKNNALAYLYYLQHEKKLTHLGLPKDEFADNGNVPYLVFVREARRIEGEATMTEADVNPFITGRGLEPQQQPASVGIGHYPIDAKPVRPKTDVAKPDKGDGDFFLVNVAVAFQVPYGAIVPKRVDGLLVPVGLSATHVAFSAVRMDPTWNVLGQTAGVAAAMSAKRGIVPRALPVDDLQRELVKQKVKLAFFWDVDVDRADFEAIQLLAVRGAARADAERRFSAGRFVDARGGRCDALSSVQPLAERQQLPLHRRAMDAPGISRDRDTLRQRCPACVRRRAALVGGRQL